MRGTLARKQVKTEKQAREQLKSATLQQKNYLKFFTEEQ